MTGGDFPFQEIIWKNLVSDQVLGRTRTHRSDQAHVLDQLNLQAKVPCSAWGNVRGENVITRTTNYRMTHFLLKLRCCAAVNGNVFFFKPFAELNLISYS